MGKRNKSLRVVSTPGQKFACGDCPARCCTAPWAYPVTVDERDRILRDEQACARLGERGQAILRAGVLPVRQNGTGLACVFLDDDQLCSLQKRHGHSFLPAPCQAFPFGFAENEQGEVVAVQSRYCPSIRDNYGAPLEAQLIDKYRQAGGAAPLAEKMGLRSGRVLERAHFIQLVERWSEALAESEVVPATVAHLFDLTEEVDAALPARPPSEREFTSLLARAGQECAALRTAGPSWSSRFAIAQLLGDLCLPARLMLAHRLAPLRSSERWAVRWMRLKWFFRWGTVDLLGAPEPVRVAAIEKVAPIFSGETGKAVAGYLREVLARRQGMSRSTYLHRVLVDLALMVVVISRYARASAAAHGRPRAELGDVREGIGVAELLFTHQGDEAHGIVLKQLHLKLMADRDDFRRLLAAEI